MVAQLHMELSKEIKAFFVAVGFKRGSNIPWKEKAKQHGLIRDLLALYEDKGSQLGAAWEKYNLHGGEDSNLDSNIGNNDTREKRLTVTTVKKATMATTMKTVKTVKNRTKKNKRKNWKKNTWRWWSTCSK